MKEKTIKRLECFYYFLGLLLFFLVMRHETVLNLFWYFFVYTGIGAVCFMTFLVSLKRKKKEKRFVSWRMVFVVYSLCGFLLTSLTSYQLLVVSLEGNFTPGGFEYVQEEVLLYMIIYTFAASFLFVLWIGRAALNWIREVLDPR